MGSKCKTCGLTERSHHPCNEAGTLYPCPDEFHREMSIVQCQQPGCTANGLTRARGWWCAIHHPEHPMGPVTPTPPAPADDASGAEAMGIPGLDFQPPRDRTPNGYTRVEAYMGQGHVVVMGYPTDESHSCDALGCGSTGAHVIARLPLPATDDPEKDLRDAGEALLAALCTGSEPHDWSDIDAKASTFRAALRREKGGDK